MSHDHRRQLRQRLAQPGLLQAPGVYDGLSALLVEQAGFEAAFMSGACLSFARFGRPDMGLVSAAEVTETIAILRDRVTLPLIVDMDTGFGNAVNVTLGLPVVRTSVDHGTAMSLAGSGTADSGSLAAALALAQQFSGASRGEIDFGELEPVVDLDEGGEPIV